MKKLFVPLTIAAILLTLGLTAFATTSLPLLGSTEIMSTEIESIEYEGLGQVEVDFNDDVHYDNPAIAVNDANGNPCTATIIKQDDDDLTFRVENIQPGTAYDFTISGVRSGASSVSTSVSGQFSVPSGQDLAITDVDYDDDGEIDIDFQNHVHFKDVTVVVTDASGTTYPAAIIEQDDDDSIEARVENLVIGQQYTVTVSGVSTIDTENYGSVSATFVAIDD